MAVSIITLLVSMLIPALSAAKQLATSTVCLGNQKGLIMAWRMYADDHDDKLVNGDARPSNWGNPSIPPA
ncbi:MAG: prepilin-type cleavage/methylation domain-containing protein, partial [Planctomycetes bacterium]|nr:prepilin-type cleavage/methylation domain-containing protein [Planctomycetota bacterium]